ncbi:ash family protein [Salmonella enterica]|nr:ash family protein [Salmonella enterica]EGF6363496.1 ash family protein [Salmonella enterica subsp. enterica serovar Braenderup]EGG6305063.1 ash family protein [Salmonella enterica subsp. enterica serovar Give]EGI7652132.1 ash family protein [Salmonella enterica subsp. enterica serovar Montevideo]EHU8228508.1 ash family protein [Salmonella enterica subsp. enterica serovar Hartford]EIU1119888.1 ash family protein [Salmonella enterica subsp. enterica serovar Typhimurium]EJY2463587.1 ash fami
MTTHKNRLLPSALMGYISPAPHKTGAGNSTPLDTKAHNRASGFFTCEASSHLFRIMVGRAGPTSVGPVSFVPGSGIPVRLTTPSIPPLGGELTSSPNKGYSSWPIANHAVPALTSSASIPRPKSTAACTARTIWRISCVSKCSPDLLTHRIYGCRQSWTTSPTISAMFRRYLTSQRAPCNPSIRPGSSGAFVHPVNREVWL